jgi:hypothetical protein
MREGQSQSHVRWYCKYHIVFVPKYRRRVLYAEVPPAEKGYPIDTTTVPWKLDFRLLGTTARGVRAPVAEEGWVL